MVNHGFIAKPFCRFSSREGHDVLIKGFVPAAFVDEVQLAFFMKDHGKTHLIERDGPWIVVEQKVRVATHLGIRTHAESMRTRVLEYFAPIEITIH